MACIPARNAIALTFFAPNIVMNKRLVWNFEINPSESLELGNTQAAADDMRWESRFFWPENTIITLNGLDESFLELSRFEAKHRQDTYYLLANADYNIKVRKEQLLYKPALKKTSHATAYGKKLKLAEQKSEQLLPGTDDLSTKSLLELINKQGKQIVVEKEALLFQFGTSHTTKLELARLKLANNTYFSVSIESRSVVWIELISHHLLGDQIACDYVTFLKSI